MAQKGPTLRSASLETCLRTSSWAPAGMQVEGPGAAQRWGGLTAERDPQGACTQLHGQGPVSNHETKNIRACGYALQAFLVLLLASSFAVTLNSLSLPKGPAFTHIVVSSNQIPFLLWAK